MDFFWGGGGDGFFFFFALFHVLMFFCGLGFKRFLGLGPFWFFVPLKGGCPLHDFYGFCTTSNGKKKLRRYYTTAEKACLNKVE